MNLLVSRALALLSATDPAISDEDFRRMLPAMLREIGRTPEAKPIVLNLAACYFESVGDSLALLIEEEETKNSATATLQSMRRRRRAAMNIARKANQDLATTKMDGGRVSCLDHNMQHLQSCLLDEIKRDRGETPDGGCSSRDRLIVIYARQNYPPLSPEKWLSENSR